MAEVSQSDETGSKSRGLVIPVEGSEDYAPLELRQLETRLDARIYFSALKRNAEQRGQKGNTLGRKYPNWEALYDSIANPLDPNRLRFGIWCEKSFPHFIGTVNIQLGEVAEVDHWVRAEQSFGEHEADRAIRALCLFAFESLGVQQVFAVVDKKEPFGRNTFVFAGFQEFEDYTTATAYHFEMTKPD